MRKDLKIFYNFINEYNEIQEMMGNKTSIKSNILEYDKYLSDNDDIVEKYKELIKKDGKQSLIISKPGSGKTYLVNKVFKDLVKESDDNEIFLILIPFTAQTQQLKSSCNMISIVGNTPDLITYDFRYNKIFAIVYDKCTDIDFLYEKYPNLKIRVIIDESHNLVTQSNFRFEAIKNLENFKNTVLKNDGSVVLMTATPQVLQYEEFDGIYNFVTKKEYKAPTKKCTIYINKTNNKFVNFSYSTLRDKIGKNTLIRLNSNLIKTELINKMLNEDLNVSYIDSDEKGYDKQREKYKNDIIDSLITKSKLPIHDYIFSTSLIDCGINIESIDGLQDLEEENIVFMIPDFKHLNLMDIEQFFNRTRGTVKSYSIFLNNNDSNANFKRGTYSKFVEDYLYKVNEQISYLNKLIEVLKIKYDLSNEDDINDLIKEFEINLNFEDSKERKNNLDCIYIDKENLEIKYDKKKLMYKSFEEYNKQFFYDEKLLKEELEQLFNIGINIEYIEETDNIDFNEETELYCKEVLKNVKPQNIVEKNFEEYKRIRNTNTFKNLDDLIKNYDYDVNDALDEVLENDCKNLNIIKKEEAKKIIENLNDLEKDTLFKRIIDKDDILMSKKTRTLLNGPFGKFIEEGFKKGYNQDEILDIIKKSKKDNDISKYFNIKQYIYYNNKYIENKELLNTVAGKEQLFVLEYFFNNKGYSKNRVINVKNLKEITDKLNKNIKSNYYKEKDIIKMIISFCEIKEEVKFDENGKVTDKKYIPSSLKREFKEDYLLESSTKKANEILRYINM